MNVHPSSGTFRHSGSALLVSLSLLALMALLSTALLFKTRGAYRATTQDNLKSRARALAFSGMERAIEHLKYQQKHYPKPENLSSYSASEGANRAYFFGRPSDPESPIPIYQTDVPLERAYWVSLIPEKAKEKGREEAREKTGQEQQSSGNSGEEQKGSYREPVFGTQQTTVRISNYGTHKLGDPPTDDKGNRLEDKNHYGDSGIEFGYSGVLPATISGGKDIYSLKIEGTAGKIYVNGPLTDEGTLTENKKMLLNNLGEILNSSSESSGSQEERQTESEETRLTKPALGDHVNKLLRKKDGKIKSINELKSLDGTGTNNQLFSDEEIDLLKQFLTPYAWTDPTTLNPQSLTHPRAHDPNLVYNRGKGPPGGDSIEPGSEELTNVFTPGLELLADSANSTPSSGSGGSGSPPLQSGVLQPRAPVNINSASKEVIQAVLMNIKAGYLHRFFNGAVNDISPRGSTTFPGNGYTGNFTVRVGKELAGQIADRLMTWRSQKQKDEGGIHNYKELNEFIYALSDEDELNDFYNELDEIPPDQWGPEGISYSRQEILAVKQAIVANINPNSRLPDPSPNFSMGIRFGDTSKADLRQWTTEFTFSSNGYYKISSLGRVLGPQKPPLGAREILSEAKLTSYMKYYDTIRMSTQKQFHEGRKEGSGSLSNLQLYPENLRNGNTSARRDGYMLLATTDWNNENLVSNGKHITYNQNFEPRGIGSADSGSQILGTSGPGKSELFNDGFFIHESRSYGGEEDYIGHQLSMSNFLQKGAVSLWVKPTWFGPEFPGMDNNEKAAQNGTRTLFSAGGGNVGSIDYAPLEEADGSRTELQGSNDRLTVFARRYHASNRGNKHPIYLVGYKGHIIRSTNHSLGDVDYYERNYIPSMRELNVSHKNRHPYIVNETDAPLSWYYPGRWHHIVFQWKGRRSKLFVDGQPDTNGWTKNLPFSGGNRTWDDTWSFFTGSNRFQTNRPGKLTLPFDGTIDDVRIFRNRNPFPNAGFNPPNRYVKEGTYSGTFMTRKKSDTLEPYEASFDGQVMNVTWTAYLPDLNCTTQIQNVRLYSPKNGSSKNWTSKSLDEFPDSLLNYYTRNQPSSGRGMPVVKKNESKDQFNEGIDIDKGEMIGLKVALSRDSADAGCSTSPILDSVTVRIVRDLPKVEHQFFD